MPNKGDKKTVCAECRSDYLSDKEGNRVVRDNGKIIPTHWRFGFFPISEWVCDGSGHAEVTVSWEPTKFTTKGEGIIYKWVKA